MSDCCSPKKFDCFHFINDASYGNVSYVHGKHRSKIVSYYLLSFLQKGILILNMFSAT